MPQFGGTAVEDQPRAQKQPPRMLQQPKLDEVEQRRSQAAKLRDEAVGIEIDSAESLQLAGDILRDVRTGIKTVKHFFRPMKEAAHTAWKKICDQENKLLAIWDQADEEISGKMRAYEAERRVSEEQERQRREREAIEQSKAERDERVGHLTKMAEVTGDRHYREAAAQEAQAPLERPAIVLPPAPKLHGISTAGDKVGVSLRSLKDLALAVGQGRISEDAVQWNESWLRKKAETDGIAFDVPGVERTVTPRLSVRT